MTCASCAARIEKKLNKLDGVEATVNFATEQATVHCDADVPVEQLVAAVESAGYRARPAKAPHEAHKAGEDRGHHHHDEPVTVLTRRLVVAIVLTIPVALFGDGAAAALCRLGVGSRSCCRRRSSSTPASASTAPP